LNNGNSAKKNGNSAGNYKLIDEESIRGVCFSGVHNKLGDKKSTGGTLILARNY
jgi:hypothetical protein